MKQKIYIAGKVTGLERSVVEKNFNTLKDYFTQKGFEVVSPVDIVTDPETEWKTAMKICIAALVECDLIYLMNNSGRSRGAMLEAVIASNFGLSLFPTVDADVTAMYEFTVSDNVTVNFIKSLKEN